MCALLAQCSRRQAVRLPIHAASHARCDASGLGRSLTSLVSWLVNQGESGFVAAPDIRCEDSFTDDEVVPTGT